MKNEDKSNIMNVEQRFGARASLFRRSQSHQNYSLLFGPGPPKIQPASGFEKGFRTPKKAFIYSAHHCKLNSKSFKIYFKLWLIKKAHVKTKNYFQHHFHHHEFFQNFPKTSNMFFLSSREFWKRKWFMLMNLSWRQT